MNQTLKFLELGTGILMQANVAAPIVGATIMAIASIVKGITGSGPSLPEIADMLEKKLGENDAAIRAEIARMESLAGK